MKVLSHRLILNCQLDLCLSGVLCESWRIVAGCRTAFFKSSFLCSLSLSVIFC